MKLYGFPPSPNTSKIMAFAAEIGLPFELVFTDISKGAARTPEFHAISPFGRTPVLVDGDLVLSESNAILQYMATRTPNDLLPVDPKGRAKVLQWQSWSLAHWGPAAQTLIFERMLRPMFNLGPTDEKAVADATTRFRAEGKVLDAHLAKTPWLVDGRLTLADFEVGASLVYAAPAGMPLADLPHVRAWYDRLASRPSWASTAPKA